MTPCWMYPQISSLLLRKHIFGPLRIKGSPGLMSYLRNLEGADSTPRRLGGADSTRREGAMMFGVDCNASGAQGMDITSLDKC